MNTENVISLEAVSDTLLPFRRVKMTALGIDYAGVGDTCIGVILPGDLNRLYPTVQLAGIYVEAVLGNGTDVVRGDDLEALAGGKLVKQVAGAIVAVAVTGATETDDRFEAIILGHNLVGLTGAQILAITHPIVMSTTTSIADSLAIPITHRTVNKTTGADAEALSLADGAFLATVCQENSVQIWDLAARTTAAVLWGPADESYASLALFGDSNHLAVALADGRIRAWGPGA